MTVWDDFKTCPAESNYAGSVGKQVCPKYFKFLPEFTPEVKLPEKIVHVKLHQNVMCHLVLFGSH
jgi:hypothetical protein